MRKLLLFLAFYFAGKMLYGQQVPNCSNWLATPTYGSAINIGQLNITGSQLTIEAEFYQTAYNTTQNMPGFGSADLVGKYTDPSNDNYLLRADYCSVTTDQGFFQTPAVTGRQLNKNYQVAMVYDGDSLKYYQNGCEVSSIAATGNLIQNSWDARIGFYAYQYWDVQFYGYINEVRIWNIARTASEIKTYANVSLPSPTAQSGLLAYYTFDNLLNKQGNSAWNGVIAGSAQINQTDPSCSYTPNLCDVPTVDSIIINNYTEVLGFDICKNELKVADATKYNPGDTVMIMQMKGAVIDSSNTTSFGNILNYNNAGNYEMNIVKSKNGSSLALLNVLQRQYDIPNGKVQLIRVPYFTDYTVNNTLTCLPWNGTVGGVLAFNVKNALTLNTDIDVSGRGFIGGDGTHGNPPDYNCYENQFYYPANTIYAAGKGEGITTLLTDKVDGKGKYANGGGGGNSHNSGGGGGANSATGGFGGYEFEGSPCDGTTPFDNRGFGGTGLTYSNAANKIFLGGGGGAGHANNPELFFPNGGNGGGICIISANTINGNGYNIYANGNDAIQCAGYGATGCHEGMGGGGGAGAILLQAANYASVTNTIVRGGRGGDMVEAGQLRVGPGGGGSGGVTWISNPTMPANFSADEAGGANGVATNYSNTAFGTSPGQPGINVFNLKIPVDTVLFKPNIDSVKINDSILTCNSFNFRGLGYANKYGINKWDWNFGDGNNASGQITNHTYSSIGTYNVKLIITDLNGCKDSIITKVTVTNFSIIKSKDTAVCNNTSIQLFASGGTSYSWTPAGSLNNPNISNPIATPPPSATTIYYVTVTNGNGCSKNDSIKVTTSTPPVISKTADQNICVNTSIQLLATGGGTYRWSPSSSLNKDTIANPVASPKSNTKYYVTVTNALGCAKTDSIQIGIYPIANIAISNDTSICTATSVQLFVSGGSSYLWSPASSLNNANSATPIATPSGNTTYHVAIKDIYNCDYKDSVTIDIIPPAVFGVSQNSSICSQKSTQLSASGGDTYSWSPPDGLNNPNIANPVANPLTTTTYTVTLHANTCNETSDLSTTVTIFPLPGVVATSSNDLTCSLGSSQLTATGATSYLWTPAAGLNNSSIRNPIASPTATTLYTVTGTDANGCSNSDTVTVKVNFDKGALYLVPNSFTPNGDGINDCFGVKYWGFVEKFDFSIYNRFGERVFHTSDPNTCWDGVYKNRLQQNAVFVYVINATTICGNIYRKGTVSLLR